MSEENRQVIQENVRTVRFIGRQSAEDLYRCKETGKVYIRRESWDDGHVRWLTSCEWTGGYEADCSIREGIILRVVNKAGSVLFEEIPFKEEGVTGTWAVKEGPFSWEVIRAFADDVEKRYELRPYEEWKKWLLAGMQKDEKIYPDNWLFAMAQRQPFKKLARLDFLGETVFATSREERHIACGKAWTCFEIRDSTLAECLAICGFKFEEV